MQLMSLMHDIINKVSEKSVREIKVLNYRYTADLWWGHSGAICMLHKKYILQHVQVLGELHLLLNMTLVKSRLFYWLSSVVWFKMPCYCREKSHANQSTVTNLSSHHDILDEPYPELKEPILDVRSMACRPTGNIWFRNSSIFSSYIWRCLSKAPMKRRGTRWNTDTISWLHVTWKAFLLGSYEERLLKKAMPLKSVLPRN